MDSDSKPKRRDIQAFRQLLESNEVDERSDSSFMTRGKVRALVGLLLLVLISGGLAMVVASPFALVSAGTSEEALEWWEELPATVDLVQPAERTVILDRRGRQFAQVFSENRVVISYRAMGRNIVNALVATEDARFFDHAGMDPQGMARAFVNNVLSDDVQGASTITQQLVENLRIQLAKNEQELKEAKASSISGKIEEVRFAQGIETTYSKREILQTYLNLVYFGNQAYGVEAAAQRYFDVPAKKLTVPQAATLVAMLKSPTAYDPLTYPKASRLRRDVVMKRMVEEDYLAEGQYRKFIRKRTQVTGEAPNNGCDDSTYPFYCQLVIDTFLASEEFGNERPARQRLWARGGLVIRTPLDRDAMRDAQVAVDSALGRSNRVAAATALIVPGKGHVQAIAQNRTWGLPDGPNDFSKTQIVYANTPSMQIGSTFKPITAAAALEEGIPASTRIDSPSPAFFATLDEPEGGFKNDNRRGAGFIDMRTALRFSVNTYFVGLTEQVGVQDVAAMARRLGLASMPTDLTGREGSITLGAYEASPIELSSAYATFAGRGVACRPVVMLSVTRHSDGESLAFPDGDCHQEISPAIADTIADLLQAPFSPGGTASSLRLNGRKAAGKTGTTNDAAATWFAGFTPQVASAVWIGDPRGGSAHPLYGVSAFGSYYSDVFGATIAGPIWRNMLNSQLAGQEALWYPKPGGVSASMTSRIIPNVQGVSLDAAVTTLLRAGFEVDIERRTAPANPNFTAENYVAAQAPRGGGKAAYGDVITLTLTAGSDTSVRIPDTIEELEATRKENAR